MSSKENNVSLFFVCQYDHSFSVARVVSNGVNVNKQNCSRLEILKFSWYFFIEISTSKKLLL